MDNHDDRKNLKLTWKYYLLFFIGLGILWLGRKFDPPVSTVFSTVGAICFFAGVFLALLWDRRRKRAEKEREKQNQS